MPDNKKNKNSLNCFKASCPFLFREHDADIFQPFMCPIAIIDADVDEYIIDEYDSVELLFLRLYYAGIRSVEAMSALTGIDVEMLKKIKTVETFSYGHINSKNGEVTQAGIDTLEDNTDMENLFQHALYQVKRELQVDALTGSLIRAEAERSKDWMMNYSDEIQPHLLPKESTVIDSALESEINKRLEQYIKKGLLEDGKSVKTIRNLRTKELKYRDAFYVWMRGFQFPFIAISYNRFESGNKKRVIVPISISEIDKKLFATEDVDIISRPNENYEHLLSYKDVILKSAVSEQANEEALRKAANDEMDEIDITKNIEKITEGFNVIEGMEMADETNVDEVREVIRYGN